MDDGSGHRFWVYPAWVKGAFQERRKYGFIILNAFLFLMPWVRVRGHQLIQMDLSSRQMLVAGSIYTPRDTIFLVLALLFASFLLFFVTAMWGRIWCGCACPQTVFLETFVHNVERWVEGPRGKRMALDRNGWSFDRIRKKRTKWTIFLAASTLIAMTFVSWFAGSTPLWTGQASTAAYGSVAFFAAVMFLDLAWFREQFCNYLCPYARFQGVLVGEDSLVITYDEPRGEPRRAKGLPKSEQGHCIDCNKCVAVCPTGIDIRDGYQLECIGCAKCVDACAPIMAKFGRENLVTYTTITEQAGGSRKLLQTRPMIYVAAMVLISVAFGGMLATRHPLDASVSHAGGSLFTIDNDGATRNTYFLQVTNRRFVEQPTDITVTVTGLPDAEVIIPDITLETGDSVRVPLIVRAPAGATLPRTQDIDVHISADFDAIVVPATFKTGTATGG
ncbi:MAG: cytochrome c oxidase accessory protein FixG [Myxococcota bacterium]|jgi:cytochrome c oxidase accessory protein FixG